MIKYLSFLALIALVAFPSTASAVNCELDTWIFVDTDQVAHVIVCDTGDLRCMWDFSCTGDCYDDFEVDFTGTSGMYADYYECLSPVGPVAGAKMDCTEISTPSGALKLLEAVQVPGTRTYELAE